MRTHEKFYPNNWEWRDALQARKRLVEGVGTNDVDYAVQPRISGKQLKCPAYLSWHSMLKRCYNADYHQRRPTYLDVFCVESWLRFSNFRQWFFRNREDIDSYGYTGSLQLDKDILSYSKTYSPKTCILVPPGLNNLLHEVNRQGDYSIGVYKRGSKFRAQISIDGKLKYKDGFNTPEEAAACRLQMKLDHVMNYPLPPWLDESVVRPRLLKIVRYQK